jgi:thymidylate synthase (FAD)
MHHAELVWVTPDAEKLIGKIARVSNPKNEDNPKVTKLLTHMIKEEHWSPFEMANMCVEIHTTRAIAPQILRHGKGFSFQEFSQRYAEATHVHMPELRRQDTKNRQNSIPDLPAHVVALYKEQIADHMMDAMHLYHSSSGGRRGKGMCPCRAPTQCSQPSLHERSSAGHLCITSTLRTGNGTQKEHQLIAQSIKDIFQEQFPIISSVMWPQE